MNHPRECGACSIGGSPRAGPWRKGRELCHGSLCWSTHRSAVGTALKSLRPGLHHRWSVARPIVGAHGRLPEPELVVNLRAVSPVRRRPAPTAPASGRPGAWALWTARLWAARLWAARWVAATWTARLWTARLWAARWAAATWAARSWAARLWTAGAWARSWVAPPPILLRGSRRPEDRWAAPPPRGEARGARTRGVADESVAPRLRRRRARRGPSGAPPHVGRSRRPLSVSSNHAPPCGGLP